MAENVAAVGTEQERNTFRDVMHHHDISKQDLDRRRLDFDKKDILFRSHIEENGWPYNAEVFDPRIFTALYEKNARLIANKPRGRMVPREGGDSLGAHISNELLGWQWDDNGRADNNPMLAKWSLMDLNARKYGASFALVKWHYQTINKKVKTKKGKAETKKEVFFDGPNMKVLNNRDCLHNPSYSTVKNWFQHREYLTLQELEETNDAARAKPIYKNLDLLREKLKGEAGDGIKGGDTRAANYIVKDLQIKNLQDFLGRDEVEKFRIVEVITEYRNDRWVTFAPRHGIILRDIPNPYDHMQIPIVQLKYYPIDDDIYGLSEIEPVEKLQRAVNALVNQYLDAINMSLYSPLKINQTGGAVQMHTLEFGPAKKWLMNNTQTDVVAHDQNITGVTEFGSTYRFMISAMQEALGETSAGVSNLDPGADQKTATEVKDLALSRSARDNSNSIYLGEAMKKQMMFWNMLDRQLLFTEKEGQTKVIRIVGKDAITYFQNAGLDTDGVAEKAAELIQSPEITQEIASGNVDVKDLIEPLFPTVVDGETTTKLKVDDDQQSAMLVIEPEDLSGTYDYIPDIESMSIPNDGQLIAQRKELLGLTLNPQTQQLLLQEGYTVKNKELIEDTYEMLGLKDADKYFVKQEGGELLGQEGQPNQPGGGAPQGNQQTAPNGANGRVQGGIQAIPGGQA